MKKKKKQLALLVGGGILLAAVSIFAVYESNVSNQKKQQVEVVAEESQTSELEEKTSETGKDGLEKAKEETPTKETKKEVKKTTTQEDAKAQVLEQYENLGVVKADVNFLNIREMPTTESLIIGKMPRYCGMNVLEEMGDWLYVASGDIVGYVASESVAVGEAAEQLALEQCVQMLEVIPETLNVYKQPSMDAEVWSKLNQNERYIIKRKVDDWYLLDFNSEDAYVSANDVTVGYYLPQADGWTAVTDCSEPRKQMIEYGMQYLGVPYVWGGTDFATGVDCSGFTLLCYAHIGIKLPRTSYTQVNEGTLVSLEDAKPGDLMFYTDAEGTVNHVAIYIGDGKILQSANSLHQVTISAYNYNTEPYAIKNIIGD